MSNMIVMTDEIRDAIDSIRMTAIEEELIVRHGNMRDRFVSLINDGYDIRLLSRVVFERFPEHKELLEKLLVLK